MKAFLPLLVLFAPLAAQAVSGSWAADASGVTLETGSVRDVSPACGQPIHRRPMLG